jgi:hypothetical protein
MTRRRAVTFRLSDKVVKELRQYAKLNDLRVRDILEEALLNRISSERDKTALEGLLSVSSRMERRVKGIRVDLETLADLVTFFVLQWFCHTPPIPESLKREAYAQGKQRYEKFLEVFREGRKKESILGEEE